MWWLQLTAPLQSDREFRGKPTLGSLGRRRSAARPVTFKQTIVYDDGQTAPVERSATASILRKIVKLTKLTTRPKQDVQRDVRAEMGVIRIYADIWNLVMTYKCTCEHGRGPAHALVVTLVRCGSFLTSPGRPMR